MQKRVEHDIHFIDHRSISFDLQILLMTTLALSRGLHTDAPCPAPVRL
jgi:lipopolysaccharide/colanic/teichoic acid biosynthesis glycosyltransferase